MPPPKDPAKFWAYKERMSELKREQYRQNPGIKKKLHDANMGKKHSEKTKLEMSESRRGSGNPNYGKMMSEEQKIRIGLAKKGNCPTIDTRNKMSESQKRRYEEKPEIKIRLSECMKGENNPNYGKPIPDEQKLKLSAAKRGERHPNFGKHLPEQTREKIRIANSGENCYHYGQSPSDETRRKMSESQKGDKCYNWKGGITTLNHSIRNCLQNRDWIFAVFVRDNFTCQKCGATKVYLHAHHIKLFADILRENNIATLEEAITCAELWDVSNGISMCEGCHKSEHSGVNEETVAEVAEV